MSQTDDFQFPTIQTFQTKQSFFQDTKQNKIFPNNNYPNHPLMVTTIVLQYLSAIFFLLNVFLWQNLSGIISCGAVYAITVFMGVVCGGVWKYTRGSFKRLTEVQKDYLKARKSIVKIKLKCQSYHILTKNCFGWQQKIVTHRNQKQIKIVQSYDVSGNILAIKRNRYSHPYITIQYQLSYEFILQSEKMAVQKIYSQFQRQNKRDRYTQFEKQIRYRNQQDLYKIWQQKYSNKQIGYWLRILLLSVLTVASIIGLSYLMDYLLYKCFIRRFYVKLKKRIRIDDQKSKQIYDGQFSNRLLFDKS